MPDDQQRRVLVISLGGTIAMTAANHGGVTPACRLTSSSPPSLDWVILTPARDLRLPSAAGRLAELRGPDRLAELIRDRFADGVDGIVVVQGTDTIEETAYLFDLYHGGPQPLVVTGAMRNPTLAGPDGPANLLAAVQTAASDSARNVGCVVVLADEIHAARRVRKTHSTAGSTFQSPNGGPLGYLVEGQPCLLNPTAFRIAMPPPVRRPLPRVALMTITLGDDGLLVDALAGRADGAVVAGFGVGHVPIGWSLGWRSSPARSRSSSPHVLAPVRYSLGRMGLRDPSGTCSAAV